MYFWKYYVNCYEEIRKINKDTDNKPFQTRINSDFHKNFCSQLWTPYVFNMISEFSQNFWIPM